MLPIFLFISYSTTKSPIDNSFKSSCAQKSTKASNEPNSILNSKLSPKGLIFWTFSFGTGTFCKPPLSSPLQIQIFYLGMHTALSNKLKKSNSMVQNIHTKSLSQIFRLSGIICIQRTSRILFNNVRI